MHAFQYRTVCSSDQDTQGQDATQLRDREPTSTREVLSNVRRIEYLKNYVGQVAPWVSDIDCDVLNNR